jgi:hypothetical protein
MFSQKLGGVLSYGAFASCNLKRLAWSLSLISLANMHGFIEVAFFYRKYIKKKTV